MFLLCGLVHFTLCLSFSLSLSLSLPLVLCLGAVSVRVYIYCAPDTVTEFAPFKFDCFFLQLVFLLKCAKHL